MFLDIKMPGLDGMDMLKRLQKDQKNVEVVIITATNREETEKEAKSLGVIDYSDEAPRISLRSRGLPPQVLS